MKYIVEKTYDDSITICRKDHNWFKLCINNEFFIKYMKDFVEDMSWDEIQWAYSAAGKKRFQVYGADIFDIIAMRKLED